MSRLPVYATGWLWQLRHTALVIEIDGCGAALHQHVIKRIHARGSVAQLRPVCIATSFLHLLSLQTATPRLCMHTGRVYAWRIPTSKDADIPPPVSLPCNLSRSLFTLSIAPSQPQDPEGGSDSHQSHSQNPTSPVSGSGSGSDRLLVAATSIERCAHVLSIPVGAEGPIWKLAKVHPPS